MYYLYLICPSSCWKSLLDELYAQVAQTETQIYDCGSLMKRQPDVERNFFILLESESEIEIDALSKQFDHDSRILNYNTFGQGREHVPLSSSREGVQENGGPYDSVS